MRRLRLLLAVTTIAALISASAVLSALVTTSAVASSTIKPGIYDDAQILYGNPDFVFPQLQQMGTKVIRANLWWGNVNGVARGRPENPADHRDPAYRWDTYDRTAIRARAAKIEVIFTIIGTPAWANGDRGWNTAPTDEGDLEDFARAAASRYSGRISDDSGQRIPAVRRWVVWNEPNNPVFLKPQYVREEGAWVIQSGRDYARMCNAVVRGVRAGQTGGRVACGATGPRGNNNPNSARPSVSPIPFLVSMKNAGATGFHAYAHHPYYGKRTETPDTPPPQGRRGNAPTAVTLGNFEVLMRALNGAYGSSMRVWVTEYGYQTVPPPDPIVGVTQAQQAEYMKRAFIKLKRNPRVDYFIWFLLRDEARAEGWQSGVFTTKWKRKESREVFEQLGKLR